MDHNIWGIMAFLFETVAEYTTEIELTLTQMRNAMKATDFMLDTSQSRQRVVMSPKEIRLWLNQLKAERRSLAERKVGAGVTAIIVRRF